MKNISFKSILFIVFLFLGIEAQAQNYFYVDIDAPAGGNGSSWTTSFNNLQTAINTASNGDIIRMSDGFYNAPTNGFLLKDGVRIYGGYNARSAPDWLINATRFYGNISTVVLGGTCFLANQNLGNQTTLDGISMLPSAGTFYGIEVTNSCQLFEMSVNNCSFGRDMNHFSSGLYGISSTKYSYVTGIFNPKINNCTFYTILGVNLEIGGTIAADISINNSKFHNNHTAGVYIYSHYSTTINNIGNIDLNINTSRFNINRSGIWLELHGNNITSTANLTNSILASSSSFNVTGIDLKFHTYLTATNCTLYGLSQAVTKTNTVLSTFNNCIFWDSNYIIVAPSSASNYTPATFNNCLVDINSCATINPSSSNSITCNNMIYNQNPQFVSTNPSSSDYLKLSNNSPARNTGNNSFIPADITKGYGGNSRILENIVDMGAYELCPSRACSSSSYLPSRKITAAASNSEINSIVYPNPATNVLNIKSESEIISISLLNIQGQEVKKWNTKNELYIGDLPIGMYLLKVNTKEGTEHIRIIKE